MRQNTERAELLFDAMRLTHEKRDYTHAPGLLKLGLINPMPVTDMKNKEFMIRAEQVLKRDKNGRPTETVVVMISREEALIMMDFLPSPAEIEARKRECEFLFSENHRQRMKQKQDAMTVPEVFRTESKFPNRAASQSEY